jgi:hypothetical protein
MGHLGGKVQEEEEVWLWYKAPDKPGKPHGASIAVALGIGQKVVIVAVKQHKRPANFFG